MEYGAGRREIVRIAWGVRTFDWLAVGCLFFAIWLYSGAPCGDAEQDEAHRAANGKPYSANNGMLLNGKWTRPGREEGCKCVSKSLIEGLDGYAEADREE